MSAPFYYISTNGMVNGPFTKPQIRSMWKSGTITANALLCREGSEVWQSVNEWLDTNSMMKAQLGRRGKLTRLGWIGSVAGFVGTFTTPLGVWTLLPLLAWGGSYFILRKGDDWRPFRGKALAGAFGLMALLIATILLIQDYRTGEELAQRRFQQEAAALRLQHEITEKDKAFWFEYYRTGGILNADSPYAAEWKAMVKNQ